MLIEFEKMGETVLPRFQGGEGDFRARMHADGLGKILQGVLEPGCRSEERRVGKECRY